MSDKDVTLIIGEIPFQCNKALLINASQYFSAMFSDHFVEKNKSVVHIQDVNLENFEIIFNYVMEDKEINWEHCDVIELLRTSSFLQFDEIQEKCVSYIRDTWLNIETCLPTMLLADELGLYLYHSASVLAQWEFSKVIHTKKYQLLSFKHLLNYLNMPGLNVTNEFTVFEAIHIWIDYDFNERLNYINVLLECINYSQLPILEINDMLFYACVNESEYAKSLLNCIKNIKIDQNYICTDENLFVKARQLVDKCERNLPIKCFIFACVDKEKGIKCNKLGFQPVILYHDTREDILKISFTLEKMCEIPDSVVGHQVIPIDLDIWIVGGEYQMGKGEWNMSVWKFNTWSKKWQHETCLPTPRRHHSVVRLENEIFVIGGVGRFRVLAETVDRYNIQTKVWDQCSRLPFSGYLIPCCTHRGSVYVFNGNQVLLMKPPLYTWKIVGTMRLSVSVDIAMSFKHDIYFTELSNSTLYKLNVNEENLPHEELGQFKVQSSTKTCLIKNLIYHWSEDDDIITLETYDIDRRQFELRWSKHRDEFNEKIHLNRTSGCFTMLSYDNPI